MVKKDIQEMYLSKFDTCLRQNRESLFRMKPPRIKILSSILQITLTVRIVDDFFDNFCLSLCVFSLILILILSPVIVRES